jgi:hypothetical protein
MFEIEYTWIPNQCQSLEEALFFAVETNDGYSLSKEKYAALFFKKIFEMIEPDDDFIEDLQLYFPSLGNVCVNDISDYDMQKDYLTWLILESEEFYFGFPPIDSNDIQCFSLIDPPADKTDELDIEEIKGEIENGEFNIYRVFEFVKEKTTSFLMKHSEESYDRNLSRTLMNIKD